MYINGTRQGKGTNQVQSPFCTRRKVQTEAKEDRTSVQMDLRSIQKQGLQTSTTTTQARIKGPQRTLNGAPGPMKGRGSPRWGWSGPLRLSGPLRYSGPWHSDPLVYCQLKIERWRVRTYHCHLLGIISQCLSHFEKLWEIFQLPNTFKMVCLSWKVAQEIQEPKIMLSKWD